MTTPALGNMEISEEERERLRKELQVSQDRAADGENETKLEDAIQRRDNIELKAAMGLDLDFDPKEFITKGVVVKKGIPINDKVFVDMKSLTTKERMLAEAMVRDRFGNMKMDAVYLTAIEAAMMAMSISRINNQAFESPDITKPMDDVLNKGLYAKKNQLLDMLLDSANDLVSLLSVLYKNLEAVTVPDEATQKKS